MALVCDYCGNVADSDRTTVAFGHNQEIALKSATAQRWFYYCNDECAEAVKAMLDNLRLYAMHGEGSGLMWQLVAQPTLADERDREEPPPKPVETEAAAKKREEEVSEQRYKRLVRVLGWEGPTGKELHDREAEGTPLIEALPHPPTTRKIIESGNVATLEEVAALCEAQFRGISGVGNSTMEAIGPALKSAGLEFADGPTGQQLRQAMVAVLDEKQMSTNDLTACILSGYDFPESIDGDRTRAGEELFSHIWKLWEKRVPPPLMVLQEIAETCGYSTGGFLAYAETLIAGVKA